MHRSVAFDFCCFFSDSFFFFFFTKRNINLFFQRFYDDSLDMSGASLKIQLISLLHESVMVIRLVFV